MFKAKPSVVATAVLLSLGLSACGGSSSNSSDKKEPEAVNPAPTALTLSATMIDENALGAQVGTLSVTDDANDTHTYTVSDERFEVVAGALKLQDNASIDFEKEPSIAVTVTVTDSASQSLEQAFTIEITNNDGVQSVLDGLTIPTTYAFDSKVEAGSSVSYSGQTARQVLIIELVNYIGSGLEADLNKGVYTSAEQVKAKLMRMYAPTEAQWGDDADDALTLSTTPAATDMSLRDISSSYKNLKGKIAGEDATGQTKNWSTDLIGWNEKGSVTPSGVIEALFDQLAANAQAQIEGSIRVDEVIGANIAKPYINTDGTDIKQLVQKFLLGAVNFSQAADDYLDNDIEGKGLLSDNLQGDKGTKAYTSLEHQFDEGFGYFGAARDYTAYTDDEIASKGGRADWQGHHDSDADGSINLQAEFNFGHSQNAAKRDRGTVGNTAATDYTAQAFEAFVTGRAIINSAVTRGFTDDEMTTLLEQRDTAVLVWEKAIAATAVHYINDTIADLEKIGTSGYSADDYADLAKHWSELKGFSLNLQFNPRSPLSESDFTMVQQKIGMKPALNAADVAAYTTELQAARDILQAAYHFDAENVSGW